MLSPMDSQQLTGLPAKKKTHRGRRGNGKGSAQHHADAKTHMANAQSAKTPGDATKHLFKALSSLKAANKAPPATDKTSGAGMTPPSTQNGIDGMGC